MGYKGDSRVTIYHKRIEDLKRDTEIPIYNSLNVTSALEMYSYIVNKLSESDFGTVS